MQWPHAVASLALAVALPGAPFGPLLAVFLAVGSVEAGRKEGEAARRLGISSSSEGASTMSFLGNKPNTAGVRPGEGCTARSIVVPYWDSPGRRGDPGV